MELFKKKDVEQIVNSEYYDREIKKIALKGWFLTECLRESFFDLAYHTAHDESLRKKIDWLYENKDAEDFVKLFIKRHLKQFRKNLNFNTLRQIKLFKHLDLKHSKLVSRLTQAHNKEIKEKYKSYSESCYRHLLSTEQ